ncbi:SagB/ThcOx family dehydrogenase [Halioxenophilus sp. WMMB6]|uniref:SagB/ThcOx family dehydrogenase n=1 Tax=Halioxenophilus sp. WMMB6 TaxID=3073815 RepID=UPI00295E43F6|nr:SagB/ThcOx family dehydrogenase [Halioxenophilus sp. WMMB6]
MSSPPDELSNAGPALAAVKQYHQLTKHRFEAYARGPETLDWDNQPNPFREFTGSTAIPLSLETQLAAVDFSQLASLTASTITPQPINQATLSAFFRLSFGLAAWKQYGPDKWALRVNPSSGNLHPTEAYCLLDSESSEDPNLVGLQHYHAEQHELTRRGGGHGQGQLNQGFLLLFSSVLWRESWKYGERAYRYCQLDVGHAMSCAAYAARSLGWSAYWLPRVDEPTMSRALGLANHEYQTIRPEEGEVAECCLYITRETIDCSNSDKSSQVHQQAVAALNAISEWYGTPNSLGEKSFYRWPAVDEVARACATDGGEAEAQWPWLLPVQQPEALLAEPDSLPDMPFDKVALNRRSAQRFQRQPMAKAQFLQLLQRLQSLGQPLLSGVDGTIAGLDLIIVVHDVEQLEPGLYVLPGSAQQRAPLQAAMQRWPDWQTAAQWGSDNNQHQLWQLKVANARKVTGSLCCQQAIAADCNFTIGYLARFEQSLLQMGSSWYRTLFWQAGSLAQQVYLAATNAGVAATGIGCFFDDPWHEFLGLSDEQYQFVYQMAVGHPIVDERITQFSGYYYLKDRNNN